MKITSQKMPFNGGVTPCPDSPTPATAHGTAGIREPSKTRCHLWTATKSVWTSSKGSMSLQALHLASTQHPPTPPSSPCTVTALRHCFTADPWLRSSLGHGQALPAVPCHCGDTETAVALGPFSLLTKRCQQRATLPQVQLPALP